MVAYLFAGCWPWPRAGVWTSCSPSCCSCSPRCSSCSHCYFACYDECGLSCSRVLGAHSLRRCPPPRGEPRANCLLRALSRRKLIQRVKQKATPVRPTACDDVLALIPAQYGHCAFWMYLVLLCLHLSCPWHLPPTCCTELFPGKLWNKFLKSWIRNGEKQICTLCLSYLSQWQRWGKPLHTGLTAHSLQKWNKI